MRRWILALGAAALSVAATTGCRTSSAAAAEAAKDALGNVRESVDLTVYKEDFAQRGRLISVSSNTSECPSGISTR